MTTQERRDVAAGVIAVALGLVMIGYGAGWDIEVVATVAAIAAAFGSTARRD